MSLTAVLAGTAVAADPAPAAQQQVKAVVKDSPKHTQAALEDWELEVLARMELLENMDLLEKLELIEDLSVLQGDGGGS